MPAWLKKALLWTATLSLMAGIFAFSAQEGASSDQLTQAAVSPIMALLGDWQPGSTDLSGDTLYIVLGTLVRKAAHLCEYALLAGLVWLLLRSYGVRRGWLAVLIAALYAVTDEVHQAFVPGRLGTPVDVAIDAVGAALGVWAVGRIVRRISRDNISKVVNTR